MKRCIKTFHQTCSNLCRRSAGPSRRPDCPPLRAAARAGYERTTRLKTRNPLGIGHYVGSAGPGEVGSFGLAGHRTTHSKPLNQIHTLEVGDALVFESAETWYVYEVTVAHQVIYPWQDEALAPVLGDTTWTQPPTTRGVTLTSCHPMYSRKQRYAVHGELDHWMPKANGIPPEVMR